MEPSRSFQSIAGLGRIGKSWVWLFFMDAQRRKKNNGVTFCYEYMPFISCAVFGNWLGPLHVKGGKTGWMKGGATPATYF